MWRAAYTGGFAVFCEAFALTSGRGPFATAVAATIGGFYAAATVYLLSVYR